MFISQRTIQSVLVLNCAAPIIITSVRCLSLITFSKFLREVVPINVESKCNVVIYAKTCATTLGLLMKRGMAIKIILARGIVKEKDHVVMIAPTYVTNAKMVASHANQRFSTSFLSVVMLVRLFVINRTKIQSARHSVTRLSVVVINVMGSVLPTANYSLANCRSR